MRQLYKIRNDDRVRKQAIAYQAPFDNTPPNTSPGKYHASNAPQ